MADLFLKAKHWQLFVLTFGIAMVSHFIMMGTMIATIQSGSNPGPDVVFDSLKLFPFITILFTGTLFGWFWFVTTGLQSKIPAEAKMKLGRFKVFFFIPLIYILFISLLIGSLFYDMSSMSELDLSQIFAYISIIFPLHLFSMFCIMHTLYFTAKTFKTAELQKSVSFSDFAGEFFLIWFFR